MALFPALLILAILPAASSGFIPFPRADGIDVDNLVSDPFAYKGDIRIRGAVMNVEPEKKIFNLLDYREYRACRTVDCPKEWVTVFFDGKLPEKTNIVEITGEVEKNPAGKDGFVLKAKAVKVK
jgi:hypothetical protein